MTDPILVQHPGHLYCLGRRVAAIAVHQQAHVVADRLAHRRDQGLGASGPLIPVVPIDTPYAHLEGAVPIGVPQAGQTLGLVLGRDVSAHARSIGGERPWRPAQQLAHAHTLQFAAQIPQCGIHAGQRPTDVRTGKFVGCLQDAVYQPIDVERIRAERNGRDLPVQDVGRDVGIVGGNLSPTFCAVVGAHAHDADVGLADKRLDTLDLHICSSDSGPRWVCRTVGMKGNGSPVYYRRAAEQNPA